MRRCRSYRDPAAVLLAAMLMLPLLHWSLTVDAATDAERRILLDFKAAVTADPRGALASWTPTGDPCHDFDGVTCDPSSRAVARLRVHGAGIAGRLTPSLARLPALESISLFGNRLAGAVPRSFAALAPTLRKLNLSRNALSGEIPPFLGAFPFLRLLDLSYNAFTGEIPAALFDPCPRIRYVSLAHNDLTGPVPPGIANCARLAGFDFSYNRLSGELPPRLCAPPELNYVSVRSNSLSGEIAGTLTSSSCRSIDLLDVGSNKFSGPAPFALLGLVNITYFNVSSNAFDGQIPSIATCGTKFSYFDASGNRLTGPVPGSLVNCRNLRVLDLGANALAGDIPPAIGTLRSLSMLRLAGNAAISGSVPAELGGMEMLVTLDLAGLALTGQIPRSLSQCQFLLELNLSGNQLQGAIPDTLNNLTYLKMLDLRRNRLDGAIPVTLGQLRNLNLLDLSENRLTGAIPPELGNLSNLTHFNVSFNDLSGMIPSAQILQQFGASAFIGNPHLCGPPLNNLCGGQRPRKRLGVSVIIVIVAAALILIGVCIVCAMNIKAYTRNTKDVDDRKEEEEVLMSESTPPVASPGSNAIIGKLVLFSKSLPSRYEDWEAGTKALVDKDCIVGGGSIGTVYKATFENGLSIAVKKLETLGRLRDQDEFEHEMGQLGNVSHANLVAFQGYYWSSSMQLLLSEFMTNESLYDHLHGNRHHSFSESNSRGEMFWERRFDIALGAARALSYLHHDCQPHILHLNIKSSNIMLDVKYEAKLSDYGLGKLLPILGSIELSKIHASIGYIAPELASQNLRYSDKSDVFSFGVVLLEIVTGRKPVESPGVATAVVLRDYVREVSEDGIASDCFDRSMRGFVEAELVQVLKLGLVCTSNTPSSRPSMAEVVQFLESIRNNS